MILRLPQANEWWQDNIGTLKVKSIDTNKINFATGACPLKNVANFMTLFNFRPLLNSDNWKFK